MKIMHIFFPPCFFQHIIFYLYGIYQTVLVSMRFIIIIFIWYEWVFPFFSGFEYAVFPAKEMLSSGRKGARSSPLQISLCIYGKAIFRTTFMFIFHCCFFVFFFTLCFCLLPAPTTERRKIFRSILFYNTIKKYNVNWVA